MVPDECQWSDRREQSMALNISRQYCSWRHMSMQGHWNMVTNQCRTQLTGHGEGRLVLGMCIVETPIKQITTPLHWTFTSSAVEVDHHAVFTSLLHRKALIERNLRGNFLKKFRVGPSHYLTKSTTKSPGLLNSHFSNEKLDHSPEA